MKFYRLVLLITLTFFCTFLSSQQMLSGSKETGGGNNGCKDYIVYTFTFFTTQAISSYMASGFDANAGVNFGSVTFDNVLTSTVMNTQTNNCQIYKHTFSVVASCVCTEEIQECPTSLTMFPTIFDDCLFQHLGASYFDTQCFNAEGFTNYASDLSTNSECVFQDEISGLCCGELGPSSSDVDVASVKGANNFNNISLVNDHFTVIPNPAINSIELNNLNDQDIINIYDLEGKICHTEIIDNSKLNIDVSNLNNGVYIIRRIGLDNNIQTLKFIKL